MIVAATNCWANGRVDHGKYFDRTVSVLRDKSRAQLSPEIYDFLVQNHDLIRDGGEADFRTLHIRLSALLATKSKPDKAKIDAAIRVIFNYDRFANKCKVRWCAYKLCATLDIKTCPYCNLSNEVTIIAVKAGRERPAIDHFFDKACYPLFAISLGNFIPSCHHCNSTYKGGIDFFAANHLNPLVDIESIQLSLDVDQIDARMDVRKLEKANIALVYDNTNPKQLNSVATFGILARYQARIEEIRTIAENMTNYSTSGVTDPLQLKWVLRNVTKANYRNQIFGKLILDFSSKYI
jgi:hypothetical protein